MRKFGLVCVLSSVLHGLTAVPAAHAAPSAGTALRQVAGVLDYVAGDYRGAVDDNGAVIDQGEYDEQLSLTRDADVLAAQAGVAPDAPLRVQLGELARALQAKAKPAQIAELCRALRKLLIEQHAVVLAPSTPPSRAEGAKLYASNGCATCHGVDGGADTDAARALDPRPANFLDPERVATVSPHRAFFALSFGVAGTAMQAYPQLNEHQRWSLAFYVLSMRHAGRVTDAGQQALGALSAGGPPSDAAGLAAMTEEDLLARLGGVADPSTRAAALAYLRAEAPFTATSADARPSSSLFAARAALQRGMSAYRKGDRALARQELVSAYVDGFEPHEAAIGARDRELVREVERSMLALRQAAANGAPLAQVEAMAKQTDELLGRAERAGEGGSAAWLGAFTIALREGLEIALLVGALLGLVRRRGQAALVRWVHAGWITAAVAGLITWWSAGALLSGLQRELAEGIAALLAAAVLIGVTHWLVGQLTSKRFLGFLADRMARTVSSQRAAWGIFGLSFVAAYREAFEIVLFFRALLLDAGDQQSRVWLGALAGLVLLVAITLVLQRVGQRLQPRPFMLASSVLLAVLAFALTGKGVRALQEAALLPITEIAFSELPWLGIHATLQGLLVQGLVLAFLVSSAVWPLLKARSAGSDPQPAQ